MVFKKEIPIRLLYGFAVHLADHFTCACNFIVSMMILSVIGYFFGGLFFKF